MKVTITIETGNEAMQTGADVTEAIARLLKRPRLSDAVDSGKVDGGKIMDVNGNTVGTWEVEN